MLGMASFLKTGKMLNVLGPEIYGYLQIDFKKYLLNAINYWNSLPCKRDNNMLKSRQEDKRLSIFFIIYPIPTKAHFILCHTADTLLGSSDFLPLSSPKNLSS